MSKDVLSAENQPGGVSLPQWARQIITAISIIAASIGGAVGVQNVTKPNTPIAPAIEEVQRAQAELAGKIATLERVTDRQAASVESIVSTLGQLVQETRENSAQVQRMAGALEQMKK